MIRKYHLLECEGCGARSWIKLGGVVPPDMDQHAWRTTAVICAEPDADGELEGTPCAP